ncbi:hypothetical protein KO361_02490 [Candidatus Woesearchaeota archaeon]|nr:hypothetical protein [Candidatus Woesearchaeota archaeon]
MSYLDQLQRTGTMDAVQRQTTQFSNAPRTETTRKEDPITNFQEQINQLQTTLLEQKNKFDRFLTINQNRIMTLEKEVNQLREELNKKTQMLDKLSDKETVQRTREALFNRKDRAPLDSPVDRNNVAPSQVQIEKIFNCSGKKF